MKFIAIIPARYASSRFPGKPLVDIGGKTMVQRVYERVKQVIDNTFVATDDDRIYNVVRNFGGSAVMTSTSHKSGTDRCAEAIQLIAKEIGVSTENVVVVNIQGDEPFVAAEQITALMECFNTPQTAIATLVKPTREINDILNPNNAKVVINRHNEAIYFSRSPIPFIREAEKENWTDKHQFFNHIGLYAYRYNTLLQITTLEQSKLELAEMLEQNRWIENGYKVSVNYSDTESYSIDTPADLEFILNSGLLNAE